MNFIALRGLFQVSILKAFLLGLCFLNGVIELDAQMLSITSGVSVPENIGSVTYTVTISPAASSTVTVNYTTNNVSAIAPGDYTTTSGTLTFLIGDTIKTITIPIINDFLSEPTETFNLTFSSLVGATFNGGTSRVTSITNDDPVIGISGPGSVVETVGLATYTVTLSAVQTYSVSVNYATSNINATAPSDYTTTTGTLLFAPGETSKTFSVPIINDFLSETGVENFRVTISNAQNVNAAMPMTISNSTADVSITNDDPILNISGPGSVVEAIGLATYTVTLSALQTYSVSVDYATSNINASAPSDYTTTTGTLLFAPGETSKTFSVPIINDFLSETGSENFRVTISNAQNVNAAMPMTISNSTADVSITNDDPVLNISGPGSVVEAIGLATYTVTLSALQTYSVSVNYATSNLNASAPSDYINTTGTLLFAPGETSKTFSVQIINDFLNETGPENFRVTISNAQNVNAAMSMTINNTTADVSITNDDPVLNISGPGSVVEAIGLATYTVTLSTVQTYSVSVNYATSNLNASAPSDYINTTGTLLFAPGEISKTFSVPIINDFLNETGPENFRVTISNALNVDAAMPMTISNSTADVSITNDDPILNISGPGSVVEAIGLATYTVTLSALQTYSVSVNYATSNINATAPSDYTTTTGTLLFAPGETSKTFSVPIINDFLNETGQENFRVTISNAQNVDMAMPMSINTSTADVSITNDDPIIHLLTPGSISENAGTQLFTVKLSFSVAYPVAIDYDMISLSAQIGSDYTFSTCAQTLIIPPGDTSSVFSVSIIDDGLSEPNEAYQAQISNARNLNAGMPMTIGTSTVTAIIHDNDNAGCGTNVLAKPVISGTTLYCPGSNILLSTSPVPNAIGYVWNGPNSFTATGLSINIPAASAINSGVYTVRAYRAGNTVCDTSVGANVNVSVVPCASSVSVKLYIEGYYVDSGRMTTALLNHGLSSSTTIVDSIDLELKNITAPYSTVATVRSGLNKNGTALATYPGVTGSYYLVVKHPSALQTWSSSPITLSASPVTYDFTNAVSKAYGNNMVQVEPGIWALYSGDILQDENIDLLDNPEMELRINSFDTCYMPTDINGDGNTDLLDAGILENNISNFIFSIHP